MIIFVISGCGRCSCLKTLAQQFADLGIPLPPVFSLPPLDISADPEMPTINGIDKLSSIVNGARPTSNNQAPYFSDDDIRLGDFLDKTPVAKKKEDLSLRRALNDKKPF